MQLQELKEQIEKKGYYYNHIRNLRTGKVDEVMFKNGTWKVSVKIYSNLWIYSDNILWELRNHDQNQIQTTFIQTILNEYVFIKNANIIKQLCNRKRKNEIEEFFPKDFLNYALKQHEEFLNFFKNKIAEKPKPKLKIVKD